MKSLTLLLIPILFLSSCSIDWNDEKDTKIAELKKQITVLSWELSNLKSQLQASKASETQTVTGSIDSQKVLLGTGFSISQTDQETNLVYSGAVIKTWSNIPPKDNPFIWDEWCDALSNTLNNLPPTYIIKEPSRKIAEDSGIQSTSLEISPQKELDTKGDKIRAWESLWANGQRNCMKENYLRTITTEESPKLWFYIIKKLWYEWADKFLFDSTNMKVYDLPIDWTVKRIEIGTSGIYVLAKDGRWNDGWVLFIKTSDGATEKLFWNNDDDTPITVNDFELLANKQIRITYSEWSTDKEITLSIN
jgi:hypothetical protein